VLPSQNPIARFFRRVGGQPDAIIVDGLEGIKHSIAKCCAPVPGEGIIGLVTPAHVVSVHRTNCVHLLESDAARMVEVRWGEGESGYPVYLRVITETGTPGLLSRMTKVFSDLHINIDMANCAEAGDGRASNIFRFQAKHLTELKNVVRRLEGLRGVYTVERLRDQAAN